MTNKASGRAFLPLLLIFLLVSLAVIAGRPFLSARNIDWTVVLTGNLILFTATAISFNLYTKALRNANMHVFIRMLYVSLLVKMALALVATLLYAYLAGHINKYGIIACFVLYIVYTYVEVKILTHLSRTRKNA